MRMGLEPMTISVRNEPGRPGVRTGSIEDWELDMSRAADAEAVGSLELLRPEPSTSEYLFGDCAGKALARPGVPPKPYAQTYKAGCLSLRVLVVMIGEAGL